MKKLFWIGLILLMPVCLFSQAPFPTPGEAASIKHTKTMVVLENDMFSGFNIYVKDAMEKYWTLTPFDFISIDDFETLRTDPAYSFLVLLQTSFDRVKGNVHYNFLNFLLGKDVRKIEEMPELGSFPMSYSEMEEEGYVYKIETVVRFMQEHALQVINDPTVTSLQFLTHYNSNLSDIAGKTLLLVEEDLAEEVNTPEKIKAVYSFPFEVVSHEDIEAAITEQRPNTVFHIR